MAAFDYIALDASGKRHKGVIEADSPRATRQLLRERALTPLEVHEISESRRQSSGHIHTRISARDMAVITRQFATLIDAGLPIAEALQGLSRQSEKPKIKSMLASVRTHVLEGKSLAQSLAAFPRYFPELYRSSVHAGERSGHLATVLEHLATFTETSYQSRQKILLALLYPAILTAVSLLIILFMMAFIVPSMVRVFTGSGQELPFLTRALIHISGGLQNYGLLFILAITGTVFAAKAALKKPENLLRLHHAILCWPILGPFTYQYNAARFSTTLGMLQESGVPLLQALEIAASVLPNQHLRKQVSGIGKQVREGISLSRALEQSGAFPPVLVTMAASGEATGRLGNMLNRAGLMQNRDLENRIAVLLGLFEPLTILLMGGFVLLLVLAIILPIINLNQLV